MYANLNLISTVPATNLYCVAPSPISDQELKENLKQYCSLGKYNDAARYGDVHLNEFRNDSNLHLENHVLHAKALMYSMDVKKANQKNDELLRILLGRGLKTKERERLFGLIVNNIGYQACFYYKAYSLAYGFFTKALEFFDPCSDEYATSLDNLARVSAKFRAEKDAETFAEDALFIRSKSPYIDSRRVLLSQISYANIEFDLGKYEEAYSWARKAVSASSNEYPRERALAHTIYGRVQAKLASYYGMKAEYAQQMLAASRTNLLQAKDIFENLVQTPIKNLEVVSALGLADHYTVEVYSRLKLPLHSPQSNGTELKIAMERIKFSMDFDINRYTWLAKFHL